EGRADAQSCNGKVMQGIGNFCMKKNIPVIALTGSIADGAEMLFANGITSIMTTVNAPMTLEAAIRDADELYYHAAVRMFRMVQIGMRLPSKT
nr:glycerate kinase [Butyrivibrio sp.]